MAVCLLVVFCFAFSVVCFLFFGMFLWFECLFGCCLFLFLCVCMFVFVDVFVVICYVLCCLVVPTFREFDKKRLSVLRGPVGI